MRSEDLYADPRPAFAAITQHLGVRDWQPTGWRTYNASTSTGMAPDIRAGLRDTFREWNERLADATGRSWDWDEPA